MHRVGDDVRVFTRNLADITHRLPEVVEVVRRMPVRDVILDGETLSLDEDGAPRPFQETMSRFGADAARETLLHPWFFDVLHVDGRDLLDEPLSTRLGELERIAGEHRIPGEVTADPDVAERVSRDALAAGQEGVVVKAIGSPYAAGRRGSSWIKVKPVHTYDLVVLACEWGSGRRVGWLSNLHLGALDPTGEFGEPGGFVMVGKTFKGLTDELLKWQTERFQEIEVRRTANTVWVRAHHGRRDRDRRCAAVEPLPGRHRAAIRAGQAVPRRQTPGRRRHDPDAAGAAARVAEWRRPNASPMDTSTRFSHGP